ncbi:NGG1p interacting factor NIF3 [Candidatus Falkowbacteria bacterium]|nr:NGG1p interacting factor NIF3 [Candidatus Falkowbacteria bacterium]
MKTQDIFALATKMGIDADLRGRQAVEKMLKRKKELYDKMTPAQKKEFDTEALTNPYIDGRVHYVSKKNPDVKKVLAGIDMEGDEVLLADRLGDIDLIMAHHPRGKALADLHDVMHLQAEVIAGYGVPINVAEALTFERIDEVARGVHPINHTRPMDIARILDISYINTHTQTDNLVATFLKNLITKKKPEYVSEILDLLKAIPEYAEAIKQGAGPRLFTGKPGNRAGKIAVTEITGGTEGSTQIYEKMAAAGVGTIIAMHQSEEHKKQAAAAHINIVIAGHMSSDSLGMNLLLDELEKKGIVIIPCSGLIRVSRNKNTARRKPAKKSSKR